VPPNLPNMYKKLFVFLLFPFYCFSQIPEYYNSIDFTQSGEELRYQLEDLISSTHTVNLIYTPEVWQVLKQSDLDPENNNNILLVYGYTNDDGQYMTDRSRDADDSCHTSSCFGLWNREHVFPRSLGTPNLGIQNAGADAHSLRPADSQKNSSRSNRPFEAGSGSASYITSTGNFFPGDEWKGDVARMMMYMYVRYPTQCAATDVGVGSTSYSFYGDMPDVFLEWNALDPVSEFEIQRNEYVSSIQGNRNPFIDNPYLATQIWNGPEAADRWEVLNSIVSTTAPVFVYPTITSGTVYLNNPENKSFTISLYNAAGVSFDTIFENNKLSLESLQAGMYFLTLKKNDFHQTFKIIRQ